MKIPIKTFKKDAFIYLSGNIPLKEFYIVKSGQIKITRTNSILGVSEEIRSSGYIVGIVQCITGIPAEENVQAISDCEIFILKKEKIEDLFTYHKKIILKILSEYSEILRKLDSELTNFNYFADTSDIYQKIDKIIKNYMDAKDENKASHLLKSLIGDPAYEENFKIKLRKYLEKLPDSLILKDPKLIYEKTFIPNTVIFTEFESADNFFIIKRGKVKITKLQKNREILLAILGDGDVFGEMAVLNDKTRNATAETVDKTSLIIVNKKGIKVLPPPLFLKLLDFLSKRIWLVHRQLICYKLPGKTAQIYYFLVSKMIQEMINPEKEPEASFVFRFPLKDLCEMLDFEYKESTKNEIADFTQDKNLEFYHDSIKIKKIGIFLDKSTYHFTRAIIVYNSKLDKM